MGESISLLEARRIALAAQGLGRPRPAGRVGGEELRALVERLALLQLDYVNLVVPSHYLVPFSRLGPYDRALLDDLAYRRRALTEQWAHEASLVPMASWPLLAHRREAHRPRPWGFERFLEENPAYVEQVLAAVRGRGPLAADALHVPEGVARRLDHSWFGSVPRAVLEAGFGRGTLAIAGRRSSFARLYDLAERVIPAEHLARTVEPEVARRELLRQAARAHGVGTAADLADYFRMSVAEARPRLVELVEAGDLVEVRVEGWRESAYLDRGARALPGDGATLLSPFDPLVWFRPRTARLFDFEYRFEIFVPAEKRRWGCYVLPFLLGERLVARVDLKAERDSGFLRVAGAWLEKGEGTEKAEELGAVAEALAAELLALASWLGLETVRCGRRGNLARALGSELRRAS